MSEQRKPEDEGKDPIEERLSPTREEDGDAETKPTAPGEATTTGTPPNNR
jgi:hypothetical protein